MFKRVLILVLFLFGVFFWLTNRNSEPKESTNNTEVVSLEAETANSEEASVEAEETAAEEEVETETKAEAPAVETISTDKVTDVSKTTPVVTASTTPQPATPVRPVVVTPTVPAKTTDVKVYVYEWGLDLSNKTIPEGTVNFKVQNNGRFTHDFSVSGFGNLGKVTPNEKKTFTVKLGAGEYEAFSKRRQDYERGVKEAFTVVQ